MCRLSSYDKHWMNPCSDQKHKWHNYWDQHQNKWYRSYHKSYIRYLMLWYIQMTSIDHQNKCHMQHKCYHLGMKEVYKKYKHCYQKHYKRYNWHGKQCNFDSGYLYSWHSHNFLMRRILNSEVHRHFLCNQHQCCWKTW